MKNARRTFRRAVISVTNIAPLLAALLAAHAAQAGLRFQQVPTLPGATATALASDGTNVWAGTPGGVWKLASGAWAPDGLAGQNVLSLSSGASVWAADGVKTWRRGADGTWTAETLPASVTQPSALATDGTSLWAAGFGVAKKTGGAWAALASPGGKVLSATVWNGDLVAGLRGNVARYAGASVSYLSAGMPVTANVQALASVNGVLWAGTDQTLYSWSGAAWVAEPGFGFHDVRAITGAGGLLRAATADAGVLAKSGAWSADNSGVLSPGALSFAAAGADVYVGTSGAPVYRRVGSGWVEAGTGLWAASISDVMSLGGSSGTFASSHGAGLGEIASTSGGAAGAGCGDVSALAAAPGGFLAATNCDVTSFLLSGSSIVGSSSASAGLPLGVRPTTLARVPADGSVAGGTPSAGMWRFVGSSWSADNGGLSGTEAILTMRSVGGALYASTGTALFTRRPSGWAGATGAPSLVQALGGDTATLFAAPATGIAAATLGGPLPAAWRADDFGANTAFVSSLDAGNGMAFAAGGGAGVLRKKDGGWQPESTGLAAGADARVVRTLGSTLYAGTAANGLFAAITVPAARTIPVVLDVTGATGARFRSELTIGNTGSQAGPWRVTFTGGGVSVATSLTVPARTEIRAADALDFLRSLGLAIPPAPVTGSLTFDSGDTAGLYALTRTYSRDTSGSYGVFLDAPTDLDAAEDAGFIYGLRSVAGVSRSNLAFASLPGRGSDPVTLSVQVYDQGGAAAGAPIVVTLGPGEWKQLNGVLLTAGMTEPAYGYAKITRTSGVNAWTGYGVVNDAKTSDGSILPLYRPGGLAAARRLVVPVVLDVFGAAGSHYTTELTLANDGAFATPVDLFYKPALGSSTGVPFVTLTLAAGQQTTLPDVIAYLRTKGLNVPDASTGPQAGTLTVEFRNLFNLDAPRTVAIARTTTPNPNAATGGAFGVAYPAAAKGGGARASALVPGLTRDASVRSNLAVVHLGGGSESALSLSVQLYDAATGQPVGGPVTVSLLPGDWTQWSGIFDTAGVPANVTQAYAVVTRIAGDDTWLAYGVLNDAQTSDGSFIRMIPEQEY
ncbi:MAG TPA: hypothetical protein PLB01_15295 [Thermoanaerobaculia bacterium]|nr:hypothetical protein [Thermoanaerobaculia bacterium]